MHSKHKKSLEPAGRIMATRVTFVVVALLAGCVSAPWSPLTVRAAGLPSASRPAWSAADAQSDRTLDPSVPTPEAVIGHELADGAVRYEPMVRYLKALADASPLVTLTPYAESHEGRTLYFVTITSEENHARLDDIRTANAKLADPRTLADDAEAQRIVDTLPGIAWLAYAIHGDELSSTDAAVQLMYQLTAGTDAQILQLRDELVMHIDPLMNPDGRERYLGQLQHLTGKVSSPDYQAMQHWGLWSAGRGNHYLFDMNRDWLMQVHPETRGRASQILKWNPHLVVDSHEMGSLDTYLFDPPREPHNAQLSPANLDWRRRFSADQAKAFNEHGWSYYTQEWYEEWYPGYTNAWTSLQGAIGILYEQAGVNAAAVKQPAGNVLTYREAVHHQLVSSFANLESLRTNRRDVLRDFLADRQWAVSQSRSGSDVLLMPAVADRARLARFVDLLARQGIEMGFAADSFNATNVTDWRHGHEETRAFDEGTLVVKAAQPRQRLLRAILEFDPRMTDTYLHDERKDLENRRGTRAYDVSAWNLCMSYGLKGYWATDMDDVALRDRVAPAAARPLHEAAYGYLIHGASADAHVAAVRLLNVGCKVRVAIKPFELDGRKYPAGSLLMRKTENPELLLDTARSAIDGLNIELRAADTALCDDGPDLGGNRFRLLDPPRIAVASQWPVSTTSFGSTWFLLDQRLGLRVSPINLQAFSMIDLRKYNVIVVPDLWNPASLAAVLNADALDKLKRWMRNGGTLIALGRSSTFFANEKRGLSGVRLRRDVLDKLTEYKEAIGRERDARRIEVDASLIWRDPQATDEVEEESEEKDDEENAAPDKKKAKNGDALKREDEWLRLFSPRGTFLAAAFDPDHWLCFGLDAGGADDATLPVLFSGSAAFMAKHPVKTPIRLADQKNLRVSGLLWPEAAKRLANSAYVTVERVGYGQLILFAADPFYRGYTEGVARAFLNALVYGPGVGASQAVPW